MLKSENHLKLFQQSDTQTTFLLRLTYVFPSYASLADEDLFFHKIAAQRESILA